MRSNMAEIGVGLVSGGVFFLALGVIMFFDATLLAMGNVLFVSGIALLIGPQKTLLFFARKQKIRGTVCFFTGMGLVFLRWAIVGVIVETVGFLNLFGYVTLFRMRVGLSSLSTNLLKGLFPCDSQLYAANADHRQRILASCHRPSMFLFFQTFSA